MFEQADLVAAVCALAVHFAVATGLYFVHPLPTHTTSTVEVDVRRRVPPPLPKIEEPPPPPPKIEEPPPPPRKVVQKQKLAEPPPLKQWTPPPNATPPKDPPKDPPKPVFGMSSDSTVGESNVAMPIGNTTMIDPSKSAKHTGPVQPLPPAPITPQPKEEYKPVSDLYIKKMPEIDDDACGRSIDYPREAEQLGIEGVVKLRVELDERGHVHAIRVTSGLGHGLDQAAIYALKYKCKFSPAIATDGKAVPYVISEYRFNFEIPR